MAKLLINDVDGYQKIIQVDKTGQYFDLSKVLWDDRIHGPVDPDWVIGGMIVDVDSPRSLKFDQPTLDAQSSKKTTDDADKAAKDAARDARKQRLKNADPKNLADVKALIKDIADHLGL